MNLIDRKAIEMWRRECGESPQMRKYIFREEWELLCDLALKGLAVPPEGRDMEAHAALVALGAMPPESTVLDGINLLAKRSKKADEAWDGALENAARLVQLELRKFYPHDKNAAAAILSLRRAPQSQP